MALEDLDGIANVAFGEAASIGWDTAADWDAAADEAGVVHETLGDYPGDGTIQMGYPSFDRGGSALEAFYTWDADSGSTVTDHSGNGRDGSHNGTRGDTGAHNTDTADWDGTDDVSTFGDRAIWDADRPDNITFTIWVYFSGGVDSSDGIVMRRDEDDNFEGLYFDSGSSLQVRFGATDRDSNSFNEQAVIGSSLNLGTWYCAIGYIDWGSDTLGLEVYNEDGTSFDTASISISGADTFNNSNPLGVFANPNFGRHIGGRAEYFRWYSRALSSSERQAIADAGTSGYLETATKSFNQAQGPDLENLSYSLNGESINLDVIGSPGTASEETVNQVLDGSTAYTLSWSNTHTDFRVRVNFSTTSVEVSPTFSGVELAP